MRICDRVAFLILAVGAACLAMAAVSETSVMADSEKGEKKEKSENNNKTVSITVREKANELSLSKGDILEIKLEMQAGTGFSWEVSKNDAALMEMKGKPTIERMGDKPGGAQLQVFRFQAKAAGKNDLELNYRRPFEKDKEPARTFKLTIQIVDAAKCKKEPSGAP